VADFYSHDWPSGPNNHIGVDMTNLAARIADIEKTLAGLEAGITDHREARAHKLKEAAVLIRRMAARIEELEKALEPVVPILQFFEKAEDNMGVWATQSGNVRLTVGHLRTAARALRGEG
jgi:hypothetical protein